MSRLGDSTWQRTVFPLDQSILIRRSLRAPVNSSPSAGWTAPNKELSEHFLSDFGKDTEGCVGMHLVLAELCVTIGILFSSFAHDYACVNSGRCPSNA